MHLPGVTGYRLLIKALLYKHASFALIFISTALSVLSVDHPIILIMATDKSWLQAHSVANRIAITVNMRQGKKEMRTEVQ